MAKSKEYYQDLYPHCEIYAQWRTVPDNLKTRKWFAERGVKIRRNESPKAVKVTCGIGTLGYKRYFLFDIEDFRDKLKVAVQYQIIARTGENGCSSEVVATRKSKKSAEAYFAAHKGKMFRGLMATWETQKQEEFEKQ